MTKLLRLWQAELKHVVGPPALFVAFLFIMIHVLWDPEQHLWLALGIKKWMFHVETNFQIGRTLNQPFAINVLPYLLIYFWAVGMGFYAQSIDWKTHTVYLWSVLPIRGITLMVSKTVAVLTGAFLLLLLELGLIVLEYGTRLVKLQTPLSSWVIMIAVYFGFTLSFVLILSVMGQFAYIVGRGFNHYRSIWMGLAFILSFYLLYALIFQLNAICTCIPDLHFIFEGEDCVINASYVVLSWLGGIGMWVLNGWLFEHWAKV